MRQINVWFQQHWVSYYYSLANNDCRRTMLHVFLVASLVWIWCILALFETHKTQVNRKCFGLWNFAQIDLWEWSCTSSESWLKTQLGTLFSEVSSLDLYLPVLNHQWYVFDLRSPNLEDSFSTYENWRLSHVVLLYCFKCQTFNSVNSKMVYCIMNIFTS